MFRQNCLLAASAAVLAFASAAGAMTITINPVAGGAFDSSSSNYNASAYNALQQAVTTDASYFSDPINVSINFDMNSNFSNNNIIGTTSPFEITQSFSTTVNKMQTDGDNNTVRATLLNKATAPAFTTTSGFTINNQNVVLTTANAKAIGITGLSGADANITFNSKFNFSYNQSATPGSNQVDFVTVVEHELLHALGFISNVDTIDEDISNNIHSGSITPAALDLFRFSSSVTPSAITPTTTRDMTVGASDVFSNGSAAYLMSTGINGDGQQASHWKDDGSNSANYIGIMDPTLAPGTVEHITSADLAAMAAIGYRVSVPEPASLAMLAVGGLLLAARRRARA